MQVRDYYRSVEEQIHEKFRNLTTNTMEEIKSKLKRKQDKISQEENLNLIEQEREKIILDMRHHVAVCRHPHCKQVEELILIYNLFKGEQLEDHLNLIVRPNVSGLPKIETDCPQGDQLNAKMRETHRMMAGL